MLGPRLSVCKNLEEVFQGYVDQVKKSEVKDLKERERSTVLTIHHKAKHFKEETLRFSISMIRTHLLKKACFKILRVI